MTTILLAYASRHGSTHEVVEIITALEIAPGLAKDVSTVAATAEQP
jgi:flavodoxin